jgi:hypothetical protein
MTIRFIYFQYSEPHIFFLSTVPLIISAIFAIIISIFLFKSYKFQKEEIRNSNLLLIAGILIILFSVLPLTLPGVSTTSMTEFETFILICYIIICNLIATIPFFIAYGVFFFIFGKKNKEEYNVFLMIAGIHWMVFYGFTIITLNGSVLSLIYFLGGSFPPISFYSMISFLFNFARLAGFVLLIIHGIKNRDKYLMTAGILGLNAFIAGFLYSFLIIRFL